MIRVLVVDDAPLVRLGLRVLIDTEEDMTLAGEAGDGRAAVAAARDARPDVVLLDIRMPVMHGLDALREMAADPALVGTKVVVLTTFALDEYVFEAPRLGASGFLIKDTDPAELVRAVRVVARGLTLPPTIGGRTRARRYGIATAQASITVMSVGWQARSAMPIHTNVLGLVRVRDRS